MSTITDGTVLGFTDLTDRDADDLYWLLREIHEGFDFATQSDEDVFNRLILALDTAEEIDLDRLKEDDYKYGYDDGFREGRDDREADVDDAFEEGRREGYAFGYEAGQASTEAVSA